ncbi:MAG: NAD(P)H-hydrate dehydratase [Thermoplasmata archaeon]|nr:NAD(P)H-hydrate dehydratase [Thermoplasmata archaeon]
MIPVLTGDQMRRADRRATSDLGIPASVLMERAGRAVANAVRKRFPGTRRPLFLCGKGNNGGDGFVAARCLLDVAPRVILMGPRSGVKREPRAMMEALEGAGGRVEVADSAEDWDQLMGDRGADLIVDAILGTGLREAPLGLAAHVIADVAAWARSSGLPVVAVDVPSGLSSDTGATLWESLRATLTVCLQAPKRCHALPSASERCGEVWVEDIGIPRGVLAEAGSRLGWIEPADVAALYPVRGPATHKGSYGHLLIIAGSVGKTGAAVLAATAALRSGVGLVTVATPAAAQPTVAQGRPEAMTEPLPSTPEGTVSAEGVDRALVLAAARDAVVLGPGLGLSEGTRRFVDAFVRRCPVPLLIDADALNALASPNEGAGATLSRRPSPTVVTPHPGEMARLSGTTASHVQDHRLETAEAFARASGAVVVLKGHRTIVARPDGECAVNPTGNPGMATGGTGDVLAGMGGALLARGADAWSAACAAVYLHGLAGDRAAARIGVEGLLAGDLCEALPETLRLLVAHG